MDLTLVRVELAVDGVFGFLKDALSGNALFHTLEHAYVKGPLDDEEKWHYYSKFPDGKYTCVRGVHRLHSITGVPFETFQVTKVPGHSGILFHTGNFNADSQGCILLGLRRGVIGEQRALISSKVAFNKFMKMQADVDRFTLTVETT
jgi:hypothetical protein